MKEILPSVRKRFWRRLRRGDLRLLVDLLSSSKQTVRISSDKYEFDSVDDLLSCKETLVDIRFEIWFHEGRFVSVDLDAFGITVHGFEVDLFALGLISRLEAFFLSRGAGANSLLPSAVWTGVVTCAAASLVYVLVNRTFGPFLSASAVGMVLLAGMMIFVQKLLPNSDRAITFRREQSAPINWRGGGWDITKIVFGAILAILALKVQQCLAVPPSPSASQPSIVQPDHPPKGDAGLGG